MVEGSPASSSDRASFPKIREDLGEDPARFLDNELLERGPSHTTATIAPLVKARIRGIDEVRVAKAWIGIEHRLQRGPRAAVVELLEQRLEYLEAEGDRRERLDYDSIPPREERWEGRTAADYEAMSSSAPGQPRCYEIWGCPAERLAERVRSEEKQAAESGHDADESAEVPA